MSSRKKKEFFFDYHGLCYHDTDRCNFVQSCRKHVQPMHQIMEQQRLWQVRFVKDTKRWAKKRGLAGKEVKDLNAFVKDKINETVKQHECSMRVMSNFEELSISSSNESVQSIVSDTSVEDSGNEDCKLASKK
jgi:hypothetical protein